MTPRLSVLAAMLVALPCAVWAAQPISIHVKTANDLADLCTANPKEAAADAKINFCHGYAQGAIEVETRRSGDKKPFCFPSPAPTRTATMTEFTNWVRALPAHRELPALDGLFQFLKERFPCK